MKILYCSWNENSKNDMMDALLERGIEVECITYPVKEYLACTSKLCEVIEQKINDSINCVISFDFLPVVSRICQKNNIVYISWVYDWPNFTLFDREIYNDCNRVFIFDRDGIEQLSRYHVNHLYYSPLAVNTKRLDAMLGTKNDSIEYRYDVSFVGNMYLDLKGAMMTENIPEYYEGFVRALSTAQGKIYGYNLVNDVITKGFAEEYLKAINLEINGTNVPREYILATQINRYITGVERKEMLNTIGLSHSTHLFTQSPVGETSVIVHGGVDYEKEMPVVFHTSKINLNITLRSITSGVPLRVFDILGAGGFCLTNYQSGIAEHFRDGEDLVMFTDRDDMLDKIAYYLSHEDERIQIARNGRRAVENYSYQKVLGTMLEETL